MKALRPVSCLRYTIDGCFLAVGESGEATSPQTTTSPSPSPSITVWTISGHKQLAQLQGHSQGVSCLAFAPSGTALVSIGKDGIQNNDSGGEDCVQQQRIIVWDWRQGTKLVDVLYAGNGITTVDWTDDEAHVITGGSKSIRYWSVERDEEDAIEALVEHRAGLMPEYKTATLTDIRCGRGSFLGAFLLKIEHDNWRIDMCPSLSNRKMFRR